MEELFRQFVEEAPCYFTVQDRNLRLIATNRLFRRDFGEGVGSFCYEVYKGRTERCEDCPVARTFTDGKNHRSEERVRRRSGEEVSVIVQTSPIRNAQGEIIAAVELSADITEIKQLQQKYRALFEEVPCYISVQDKNLRITEANRRFRQDFGEGTGEPCYQIYKHRSEPCIPCPVAQTFQDGAVHRSEEVVTSCMGRAENVLVTTAPLRDAAGEITQVMEMSANITELRQLQTRLTSLGLLVGSISHDIKGMLSGLDGGIYMMTTGFKKDRMERVKDGWEMVQRNVDRIRSMVLNVLYYAKDREVAWQPVDAKEVAEAAAGVLASRAAQLGIQLRVTAESGTFEADHHAVSALLVNLVENSLDACRVDPKGGEHAVSLTAHLEEESAIFEVADDGIGMDQETQEKAFSLFFSSKGAAGTGLGLFIAQKIVLAHGGEILIDSTPGAGSRFTVRLPRRRPAHLAQDASGATEADTTAAGAIPGSELLLAGSDR